MGSENGNDLGSGVRVGKNYPLEAKTSSINLEIGLPVLFFSLLSLFIVLTDNVRLMRFL